MSDSLSSWLALRESADRAARSVPLTQAIAAVMPRGRAVRVLDLAAGTGANFRYLTSRLDLPQEWLLVDIDPVLLDEASARVSLRDGVTVDTRAMNLGPLDQPDIIAGRDLVTASALLDLVSETWLRRLARRSREAGAAALFALTYDGRSTCSPPDADDEMIRELMNRHQRNNDKGFGKAAGPDGADAAERSFTAEGYRVQRQASDWHVPAEAREFQRQLFEGWAQAAIEIEPDRSAAVKSWVARRLTHLDAGRSTVMVGHQDLIAIRSA